ncbi:class I SAM-dependent methyltransferase [Sulfurimonas sp.]|uniref:class I SAM-dependent methyltransferase n=1 Tax=Sulfurimonas sp. TaxID=2022749 RepID=UPI0035631C10
MLNTISKKTILLLNHLFKKASWFDILNKSDKDTLNYALKSGEVVLKQFDGFNDFKDKTVLDFGCGFGGKTAYYSSLGAKKVYGVDFHSDFSLVQNYCEDKALNIDFLTLKEDGLLPLEDASVDVVISSAVFEHVLNIDTALKEIKRILKPDGLFLNRWHPYATRHGSHVNGLIGIPFVHLFFSEKNIMQVYEQLLKNKTDKIGHTLLYKVNDKEFQSWGDIGLQFNYLNIKQMSDKMKEHGFDIFEKRYFLDKSKHDFVKYLPDYFKTFFIDYEIIISRKNE